MPWLDPQVSGAWPGWQRRGDGLRLARLGVLVAPFVLAALFASGCFFEISAPAADEVGPSEGQGVDFGASWKYLDTGLSPMGWQEPEFDASSWSEGPAPLGYGEGNEATVVSFGEDPATKHVTTLFRKTFVVESLAAGASVRLAVLRDDGIVVYLNGTEVLRDNLPLGPILSSTLAPTSINGDEEQVLLSVELPTDTLLSGSNLIAVELHQSDRDSSDISFDLELAVQASTQAPP